MEPRTGAADRRRIVSRREFTRTAVLGLPALSGLAATKRPGPSGALASPVAARSDTGSGGAGVDPAAVNPAAVDYDDWTVIDALGFPGDRAPDRAPRFSAGALADIRASGVTAVNTTVGTVGGGEDLFERTVASVGQWQRAIRDHAADLLAVRTTDDIRAAKRSGRLGIILGFQDAAMLEGRIDRVDVFHDLGVKVIQLTYNRRNELGFGSIEAEDRGLTAFGREVVARMNDLGVLVDLSHCGHRTTEDGIRASAAPVAITHTGCHALAALPRNKPDRVLRLLAERGGVVGIYFMPFLREAGQPMAEDVIRHLERALDLCGEDHVGIGTDGGFGTLELTREYIAAHKADVAARRAAGISAPGETDDVYTYVPDLNSPRRLETLAAMLAARGHSSARIEKILGGNFLRLTAEVW